MTITFFYILKKNFYKYGDTLVRKPNCMFRHVITGWAWKKEDNVIDLLWRWFAGHHFKDHSVLLGLETGKTAAPFDTTAISGRLRRRTRAYKEAKQKGLTWPLRELIRRRSKEQLLRLLDK